MCRQTESYLQSHKHSHTRTSAVIGSTDAHYIPTISQAWVHKSVTHTPTHTVPVFRKLMINWEKRQSNNHANPKAKCNKQDDKKTCGIKLGNRANGWVGRTPHDKAIGSDKGREIRRDRKMWPMGCQYGQETINRQGVPSREQSAAAWVHTWAMQWTTGSSGAELPVLATMNPLGFVGMSAPGMLATTTA